MSKKVVLGLIAIMALAIFFRLWMITSIPPGLYPDEAMNGNNALEAIHTGDYKIFYPENNGREGLFINIQSLSIRIFGNEPWALRIVSSLFGILTVLGLFFLAKELFKNNKIALFASFFLAASFWHINFSRIGFRAIMAPAFLVWSMFLLFKTLGNRISTWKSGFLAVLGGLIFGLGFHSYIAYRAAPLLLILPFIFLVKNRNYKPVLLFLLGAFIAGLPLGLYFLNNPQDFLGRTSQISIFSSESPVLELGKNIFLTIGMFFVKGDLNWRHNFAGAPALWWPVAILFLVGVLKFGLWDLFRNLKLGFRNFKSYLLSPVSFLLLWIIMMLLPVVISSEGLPHALRAIIVIPPVMILSALGLDWLIDKTKQWLDRQTLKFPDSTKQLFRIRRELMILVFVLFATISIHTFVTYFFRWAYNPNVYWALGENYAEIGRYLRDAPQDVKKYVIINADGTDVRDIPMPSQTIMFFTDTFLPEKQNQKNLFYITESGLKDFIQTAKNEEKLEIILLETDSHLRQKLADSIPNLSSYQEAGILIQRK